MVNTPQPVAPVLIVSTSAMGVTLTVTFDQPIAVNGTPGYTLNGVAAVSAVQTAPNIVAIAFASAINNTGYLNVGFRDSAIRNASGGFVTSNVHALAA